MGRSILMQRLSLEYKKWNSYGNEGGNIQYFADD
jgi:hypothetical protein